jgi:hypothetical protein
MFKANLGQIVHKTLSQIKPTTKKGWWNGSRCRTRTKKKKKVQECGWVLDDPILEKGVGREREKTGRGPGVKGLSIGPPG